MMEVYPVLSVKPSVRRFTQGILVDPVHRATFGSGAILTRTYFSDVPVKYGVSYSLMPNDDKEILEPWERDNIGYGGLRFEWTNILDDTTYVSLLVGHIAYTIHQRSKGNYWKVDLVIATLYEKP